MNFRQLLARIISILCLFPGAVSAQSVAVTHCDGECPRYESRVTANQSNLVIHHLYAAAVNGETSLPDWVAYRLNKEALGVASLIPRSWQPDRLVHFSPLEDIVQAGEEELGSRKRSPGTTTLMGEAVQKAYLLRTERAWLP